MGIKIMDGAYAALDDEGRAGRLGREQHRDGQHGIRVQQDPLPVKHQSDREGDGIARHPRGPPAPGEWTMGATVRPVIAGALHSPIPASAQTARPRP